MDLGLKGRVALVTGSSRGIGRSTANLLSQDGAFVGITYRHDEQPALELLEEIQSRGGQAIVVHYDLESAESIRSAVQQVVSKWGKLDILINNAVEFGPRPVAKAPWFENWPVEEWQYLLRSNIEGVFQTTQISVPHMRRQKWGRIVFVSSTAAEFGLPGSSWYSMAKAAFNGLAVSLCRELAPFGILVNGVMPGPTDTMRVRRVPPLIRTQLAQTTAVQRLLDPDEVARVILFLCSEANTGITGEIILIGGVPS